MWVEVSGITSSGFILVKLLFKIENSCVLCFFLPSINRYQQPENRKVHYGCRVCEIKIGHPGSSLLPIIVTLIRAVVSWPPHVDSLTYNYCKWLLMTLLFNPHYTTKANHQGCRINVTFQSPCYQVIYMSATFLSNLSEPLDFRSFINQRNVALIVRHWYCLAITFRQSNNRFMSLRGKTERMGLRMSCQACSLEYSNSNNTESPDKEALK